MKLIKRLKNLWRLSAIEVQSSSQAITVIRELLLKNRQATIISPTPQDDIPVIQNDNAN